MVEASEQARQAQRCGSADQRQLIAGEAPRGPSCIYIRLDIKLAQKKKRPSQMALRSFLWLEWRVEASTHFKAAVKARAAQQFGRGTRRPKRERDC